MMLLFRSTLIAALFSLPLVHSIGCSSNSGSQDADPFDTFQACWDEHHSVESFSVQHAIEICCISHPIGSDPPNVVCGDTAATCTTYVTANLTSPDLMAGDISAACTDYVATRAG